MTKPVDFKRVGSKRLLKLADFLENGDLQDGQFDMSSWTCGLSSGKSLGDCGTAACAWGWATTIPSFQRAGLKLNNWKSPSFRRQQDASAARLFFALSISEADGLFVPTDCGSRRLQGKRGRKTVASRIRSFVKRKLKSADGAAPDPL